MPGWRPSACSSVRNQREPAARAEHAPELGEGGLGVEVMERVPDHDRLGPAVAERDRLGGRGDDGHVGRVRREDRAHVGGGFDGDDPDAEASEPARELSGPGRQVDHERSGFEPGAIGYPPDRLVRVGRAQLVVVGRVDVLEAEPHRRASYAAAVPLPDAARTPARRPATWAYETGSRTLAPPSPR
jgi:hypothetical protein